MGRNAEMQWGVAVGRLIGNCGSPYVSTAYGGAHCDIVDATALAAGERYCDIGVVDPSDECKGAGGVGSDEPPLQMATVL